MFEYKTKSFFANNPDGISDWLNALYKGGFGVKVVGYAAVGIQAGYSNTIMVTALRWKLSEVPKNQTPASGRTTIDEIPEVPAIDYDVEK